MLRGEGAPPLRRQIAARVATPILEGGLAPGTRLPSVRALAGSLGVGRSTVAASYRELASRGLVVSEPGSGVFVARSRGTSPTTGRRPAAGEGGYLPDHDAVPCGHPLGFLLAAREAGRKPLESASWCGLWAAALAARRAAVLAAEPALARVVAAELTSTLSGGRFRAVTGQSDGAPLADRWLPVRVQPPWTRRSAAAPEPIVRLQVGAPFREQVRRLRPGAVLRLLTGSAGVARLARDAVRERLGARAAVLAIEPEAPDAASRLRPDGLSWADHEAYRIAPAAARCCRLLPVVALRSLDELAAVLELEPRHPRCGGRRP